MSHHKVPNEFNVEDLESNFTSSSDLLQHDGEVPFTPQLEEVPQGRHLGLFSTIVLIVSRILGSGFLAISSGMYNDCGRSPFFFFLSWIVAFALAFAGLYVYLELGLFIPRSGGTKAFLEVIYDRPYMLTSVVISLYSVLYGFTILNLLVFGEYFLHAIGIKTSDWNIRLAGLAMLYFTCAFHGISVHHGVRLQNFIGGLKLLLAASIVLTGLWVTLLPQSITHIKNQLHMNEFFPAKSEITFGSFASAIIKGTFACAGWNSIHTVTNEIKDPNRTLKIAGPVSLLIITVTYIFINIAYLVVIPDEEIINSGQLIGSLLFEKIFGYHMGRQFLTIASAVCAAGNVFVVLYTISRVSQEVFREGFLPFSKFMSSNWPGDAPLPTLVLSCAISTAVLIGFPHGDVYNYIVSLESYPQQIFVALCAIGVFIMRRRYPRFTAPIRSTVIGNVLVLIISSYLTLMPLIGKNPNPKGLESWLPYPHLGLLSLLCTAFYWFCMFKAGPRLGNYQLAPEAVKLEDGLVITQWNKVPETRLNL